MAMKNETGKFNQYDKTNASQTPRTEKVIARPMICQTVRPQRIAELAGKIIKIKINNEPTICAETATVTAINPRNNTSIS